MIKILWIDDEIEHFKSHILFLNKKGYHVDTCKSGPEAIGKYVTDSYFVYVCKFIYLPAHFLPSRTFSHNY